MSESVMGHAAADRHAVQGETNGALRFDVSCSNGVLALIEIRAEPQKTGRDFVEDISEIEEALYQVKNRSGQDPLNFPIRLNDRLASLRRSVENGDAKPTNAAYEVFDELSAELAEHLTKLEALVDSGLGAINAELEAEGVSTVERQR
jgi:hypothetical protein